MLKGALHYRSKNFNCDLKTVSKIHNNCKLNQLFINAVWCHQVSPKLSLFQVLFSWLASSYTLLLMTTSALLLCCPQFSNFSQLIYFWTEYFQTTTTKKCQQGFMINDFWLLNLENQFNVIINYCYIFHIHSWFYNSSSLIHWH